jgi:hypothetical protein
VRLVKQRPGLAAALALGVTSVDLAVANSRYVITASQSLFEGKPKVLSIIEEDAKQHPYSEPYRIHRMPLWSPVVWSKAASEDRVRDFVEWERATLQPKHGLPYGVQYTYTLGVAELYDYEWFFGGFLHSTVPEAAAAIGVEPGSKIVVYPRRSYDMWNTRYFILPMYANNWTDENRGFASFLAKTEPVYPPRDAFRDKNSEKQQLEFVETQDFQVRRNLDFYPRAWVVHGARFLKPINSLNRADRKLPMEEIIYSNEPFWHDPTRVAYDPRKVVWLEQDRQDEVVPFLDNTEPGHQESVSISRYEPDRVELRAKLDRPGIVVLADVYYPGWSLTIDGKPAPVYRANRLMRGAAVPAGEHTLVYSFRPASFRYGMVLSCAGGLGLVVLGLLFAKRPVAGSIARVPS